MSNIAELIEQLSKDDQQEIYSLVCTIIQVNEGERTVNVTPKNGGVDVFGVRLQAIIGKEKGFVAFPKVGSEVIVTFINKYTGYVSVMSEIDGYIIETGNESLKSIISDLIDAINAITVTTPQGPSTPPLLNKAQFDTIKLRLEKLFK